MAWQLQDELPGDVGKRWRRTWAFDVNVIVDLDGDLNVVPSVVVPP